MKVTRIKELKKFLIVKQILLVRKYTESSIENIYTDVEV